MLFQTRADTVQKGGQWQAAFTLYENDGTPAVLSNAIAYVHLIVGGRTVRLTAAREIQVLPHISTVVMTLFSDFLNDLAAGDYNYVLYVIRNQVAEIPVTGTFSLIESGGGDDEQTTWIMGTNGNHVKVDENGMMSYYGKAVGNHNIFVPGLQGLPLTDSAPELGVFKQTTGGTSLGTYLYWFPDEGEPSLLFTVHLPAVKHAETLLTPYIFWTVSTDAENYNDTVVWGVELSLGAVGDEHPYTTIFTVSRGESLAAGELYKTAIDLAEFGFLETNVEQVLSLRLFRAATDEDDTYTANAGLHGLLFTFAIFEEEPVG